MRPLSGSGQSFDSSGGGAPGSRGGSSRSSTTPGDSSRASITGPRSVCRPCPLSSNTWSSTLKRAPDTRTPEESEVISARSISAFLPASQLRSSASTRNWPSATVSCGRARSIVTRSSPCAVPESADGGWRSIAGMLWPCSVPEKLA